MTTIERPPDLIVLGPPGSGKSTQAARLARHLGLVHLNPGRLFREEAAVDSSTGQEIRDLMAEGRLVPDEITNEFVRERLEAIPPGQGIVLDGYPRTADQAEVLHRLLAESGRMVPSPVVVRLDVPRAELLERLRRRRELDRRGDDSNEAIVRRLETHDAATSRVLDAVSDWADVVTLSGARPVESLTSEITKRLDDLGGPGGGDSDRVDARDAVRDV